MKKIRILFLGLMTLSFVLMGCSRDKDDSSPKPVTYLEDGFYVVGEATTVADLLATNVEKALMAAGINEADKHTVRTGMYEKYVALEGGKPFSLIRKAGANETVFGAALKKVALYDAENKSVNEQPVIDVYKGTLAENGTLQVAESGLYHVILDINLKTIIIAPVEWGVRGAMNGWGFTAFPKPAFNKTSMTYKLSNVTVEMAGGFKFAYGGGWKIELSGEEVKANTNLGNDGGEDNDPLTAKLAPGGKNIGIERAVWDIELTWTLGKGAIKEGFAAKLTKTGNLEPLPEYPENIYTIGSFADWNWESDKVITMTPVHSHPNAFWTITYFEAGTEFKFAPVKSWTGDFGASGEAANDVYAKGGENIKIATAGYYLLFIDLKAGKIFVGAPSVYLIGECSKDGKWDAGIADNKFAIGATGLTANTFKAGKLRMYATCPSAAGVDWWQMEFNIFNGKIVYRGKDGDQNSVEAGAGKNVTLDFKIETGKIE